MSHAVNGVLEREQVRRTQLRAFDQVIAEMLVEPRPPSRRNAVAWLEQRTHALARPTAYKAEMTAVATRQQFDDGGGFAVPPYSQYDPFVGPFHGMESTGFRRAVQHVGWAKRSVTTLGSTDPSGGHGAFAPLPALRLYALNQPLASPVNEE